MNEKLYRIVIENHDAATTYAVGLTQLELDSVVGGAIDKLAAPLLRDAVDAEGQLAIERTTLVAKMTAKFTMHHASIPPLEVFGAEVRVEEEPREPASSEVVSGRGTAVFYRLCREAYVAGIVSAETFAARLEHLSECCDLPHLRQALARVRRALTRFPPSEGDGDNESMRRDCTTSDRRPTANSGGQPPLAFMVRSGGLQNYEFICGDPDPLPSVPHGHLVTRHSRKLDAYLGQIFDHTKPMGKRLPKADLTALWNDESFRRFATRELRHFIATNPNAKRYFDARGVRTPLRLPRVCRSR